MLQRINPENYFIKSYTEDTIPSWVPFILAISLIGSFTVAIIAIWRSR